MQIEGSLATDDSAVKPHRCLRQGQVFYPSFLQMVGLYLSLKTHMVHWICQTSQWGGWRVTWVRFEDSTASSPYPCKYAWAKRERTAFSHKRGWFYQDRVLVSEDRRWLLPGFCGESWCELQRSADAGSMLTDQCAIDSCLEKAYTVHPSLQMVCVCVHKLSQRISLSPPVHPKQGSHFKTLPWGRNKSHEWKESQWCETTWGRSSQAHFG